MPRLNKFSNFFLSVLFLPEALLFPGTATSQVSTFSFDHLTIDQGLSNNIARCFCQDSKGFIWIGTMDGLNRYDGYSFKTYNHSPRDSSSISDNDIYTIEQDRSGRLWVGTPNGLNLYDAATDRFSRFHFNDQNGNSDIVDFEKIKTDRYNNVWLGTDKGIVILQPVPGTNSTVPKESFRVINLFKEHENLKNFSSLIINDILFDHNNDCWIASSKGLIKLLLSPGDSSYVKEIEYIFFKHDKQNKNSISTDFVTDLAEDNQHNLWCASIDVLFEKIKISKDAGEQKNQTFVPIHTAKSTTLQDEYRAVWSLLSTSDGKIFAGTFNNGLIVINTASTETRSQQEFSLFKNNPSDAHSISGNQAASLFKDRSGLIWIGTDQGISIYNPFRKNFNSRNNYRIFGDTSSTVNSIVYDEQNGLIWIGTDNYGIKVFREKDNKLFKIRHEENDKSSISENSIKSLLYDQKGNIWAGTSRRGLNLIEKKEIDKIITANENQHPKIICRNFNINTDPKDTNSINGSIIFSLAEDAKGTIWAGTQNGFCSYDFVKNNFTRFFIEKEKINKSFNGHFINYILPVQENKLWLGTENGLILFTKEHGIEKKYYTNEKEINSISSNRVTCLFVDSKSNLWVGTNGGGLNLFNEKKQSFRSFGIAEGLPNNVIHSIREDHHGNLWISTNFGLVMMNISDFSIIKYNTNDGLTNNAFATGSSWKSKKGELFFGNNNGFNSFFPDSIRKNSYLPSVAIVDIKISESSIFSEKFPALKSEFLKENSISLSPGRNNITFQFSSLSFINPAKNQYKYKLEGYDKGWIYSGNFRYVSYTNLDPGNYVFRVIASNNDGVWNNEGAFCKLIIEPPFTKTWYFKALLAFFFAGAIFSINRIRIKNIENQKQREIAIHSAKMKEEFLANMSHEIRTPLNAISGMTNLLLKKPGAFEQNKYLNAIRQSSDNLNVIINDILDFSKIEAGKISIELADFSVAGVLENLKETLQHKATEKGIVFSVSHESGLPAFVIGDSVRLSQVLINLAGNSIKFTSKGFVSVHCKVVSENEMETLFDIEAEEIPKTITPVLIYFEIVDSGIGISEDKIDKVFESFTQASSDTTRRFGGTGLGLTITKRLIDLQNGRLKVESKLNEGSKFSFMIPYQSSTKKINISKDTYDLSFIESQLNGIRILLAEDNVFNQIVAVDTLKSEIRELTIDVAENGKIALEKLMQNSYDLILMDVQMPEMDGLEATTIIRTQFPQDKKNIPVLAMTAGALQTEINKCFAAGMNDFITKPIVVDTLIRKISIHYYTIKNKA